MEPKRMMLFIDGENLVMRYQSMLTNGLVPQPGIFHQPDIYVWHNNFYIPTDHHVIRAHYYTSLVGDDEKLGSINSELKKMEVKIQRFDFLAEHVKHHTFTSPLYPVIIKKSQKSNKTKLVDIRMAVDILTHVYQDNLDAVYLLSGDGDYEEVIREVIRKGKQIFIGAFSDGLNPVLKTLPDQLLILDSIFFDFSKKSAG